MLFGEQHYCVMLCVILFICLFEHGEKRCDHVSIVLFVYRVQIGFECGLGQIIIF